MIIGIDTGGTFTDFIYKEDDKWGVYKVLSSPSNPAEAVLDGLKHIVGNMAFKIVHGSTVATNAILERKGALTALITNKGFEDILEIGRQNRTELYNLSYQKNRTLVSPLFRYGIDCRVDLNGNILNDIKESELEDIINKIKTSRIESVAVCLLFSYTNNEHELKIGEYLSILDIPFSLSHKILSEFREYERMSTTVINAYVSPKMKRYIKYIIDNIGSNELRIMQSNGGSISAETAMNESVKTILSGPAGGVVGAYEIGKLSGHNKLISFDMGGTSTDVSLIYSKLPLALESKIASFPVKVPMIDINTVGAGGGSIAYIDTGGSLRVGPESAGADPGPICYGKGDKITVTDANLYLGRLIPEHFLGGNMRLKTERLEHYFKETAKKLGLSTIELAEGILSIANTSMEKAIRVISIERGFDPREFILFSFGGAGGMHAVFLAKLLQIPKVLVPKNPGILSAIGMLMADIIKDYSLTVMKQENQTSKEQLKINFKHIEEKAKEEMRKEGIEEKKIQLDKYIDMRYVGQSYEIMVPFDDNYVDSFHKLHKQTYGYSNTNKQTEIVNIRLRAKGTPEKPHFKKHPLSSAIPAPHSFIGYKEAIFDLKRVKTGLFLRDKLKSGNVIDGPVIIVEYSSTIILPPNSSAFIDEYENLIINVQTGGKNEN